MSKGHVLLCRPCANHVGLRESFLMLNGAQPCEGCGTTVGYECTREPVQTADGDTIMLPRWGKLVAPYMEMWRHKMWPVAFGIALQDFAGVHVHEWNTHYSNFQTGEHIDACRCGEKRTRYESAPDRCATPEDR